MPCEAQGMPIGGDPALAANDLSVALELSGVGVCTYASAKTRLLCLLTAPAIEAIQGTWVGLQPQLAGPCYRHCDSTLNDAVEPSRHLTTCDHPW